MLININKIMIDFCVKDDHLMLVSASDHDILLPLNLTTALELAHCLQNPCNPAVVKLDNDRCEKRHIWKEIEIRDGVQSDIIGYVGICSDQDGIRLKLQKNNTPVIVGSIGLTDVDVRFLVGLLYLSASSQFISATTIGDLFNNDHLSSDNVEINNVLVRYSSLH